jgi:hypothetical protein
MSIFGFGEIKFGGSDNSGPLNALNDNQFRRTTLRYPLDIGAQDKAHYIVIYIRQQKNTSFGTSTVEDSAFDAAAGAAQMNGLSQIQGAISSLQAGKLPASLGGDLVNKINSGLDSINKMTGGSLSGITKAIGSAASSVVGGVGNLFGQTGIQLNGSSAETETIISNSIKKITNNSFIKTTKLTTDAIALYMPDTLNYTYTQSYSDVSMGGELAGQAAAAAKSAIDAAGGQADPLAAISKALSSGSQSLGQVAAQKGSEVLGSLTGSENTAKVLKTAITGTVQNPMMEMIYQAPQFREFSFDFKFYPRDEKEALEVQRIIERLRFHQAPEFFKETQGFLVPPSEFDIKFYYNGSQNPNIPPMGTAVLTSIQINYAPEGFSTYEVPGESSAALGRTGMPVAIQVMLNFKETSYLTKADFKNEKGISTQAKV